MAQQATEPQTHEHGASTKLQSLCRLDTADTSQQTSWGLLLLCPCKWILQKMENGKSDSEIDPKIDRDQQQIPDYEKLLCHTLQHFSL